MAKKQAIIYPDGSGHALSKFCTDGVKGLKVIQSARIKVGKDEVIIYADSVSFDGARLTSVLDALAREILRLGKRLRTLETIAANKKAGD